MSITDKLKTLPEIRDEGKGYLMVDDGACEIEVGEFLFGLVRILKPQRVLSTGIYTGISDLFIAGALKENGFGHTDALEFEKYHIARASLLWNEHAVDTFITAHLTSSLDFNPIKQYQLMFLDTEPNLRFHELVKFYPYLDQGGYVFIHDTPRTLCQGNINPDHPELPSWPFGNLPDEIKQWLRTGELVKFNFPNPRGMTGFYKRAHDDYDIR